MSAHPRPVPGEPRRYLFPAVEKDRLANGVGILVARMPRLPLVSVVALVDTGATNDPVGSEGLAFLTALSLVEGTGTLDGAALTERFERLGTVLESSADWDASSARFTVMPSRLAEAFTLFAEVVRNPSLPETDVMRKREERLADLEQRLTEPRGLADQRFTGFLYRRDSRYARLAGGTLTTVPRLSRDQVQAFHAKHFVPRATTLIFVGDVTADEAKRLAEQGFGSWRGDGTAGDMIATEAATTTRRAVIVAKEDAPQSELRVGHVGVPRLSADHLDIVVMNAILGGLFSSRINLNLREKHAFTYGASSGFDWRRGSGPFVVSTAVKSEVTDRAIEEIVREMDALREKAPDASEVALATDYLAGVFPIRYESTDAVAGALAGWKSFGLPDDWFTTYRDQVRAITPARVLDAARRHLDPSKLLVLAVGDPKAISEPMERLALGELRVVPPAYDPAEDGR